MTDAWTAFKDFVERTEDLPVGMLVRGACKSDPGDEVIAACVRPSSAADLMPVLFRRQLDRHQMGFALGEALAHLHYLERQGALTRNAGSDGVNRFLTA